MMDTDSDYLASTQPEDIRHSFHLSCHSKQEYACFCEFVLGIQPMLAFFNTIIKCTEQSMKNFDV